MIQLPSKKQRKWKLYNLVLSSIFFITSFLYVWLRINPVLYYQSQEPIFFLDRSFFQQFLSYSGGLAEYISAFLSQFYYIPWAGSLIVILLLFLTSMTMFGILKKLDPQQPFTSTHLIPAALLLILHNKYDHELVVTVNLLISLIFTFLFLTFNFQKPIPRLLVFTLAAPALYYIIAGSFFLFVLMIALAEMVYFKRSILPVIYIIIAVIIPYILANYFLLISVRDSYFNFLFLQFDHFQKIMLYLLYLCFMFLILWPKISNKILQVNSTENKLLKTYDQIRKRIPTILTVTVQAVILLGGAFIILNFSFNDYIKKFLLIDYHNRHENWYEVLKACKKNVLNSKLTAFQINRALYHTGQLGEKMFFYPQIFGVANLINERDYALNAPLNRSDLYYDFGHVNEAEHWAIEAIAVKGYSPYNLQRLALVKLLKGDYKASEKCLLNLKKNFLFSRWAEKYLNYVKDPTLISKDTQLNEITSYMIDRDFIVDMNHPEFDMERYLEFNKNNKPAFEYLMAYYLLSRELLDFIKNLDRLKDFPYTKMPGHYEEAIAVYLSVTRRDERISQHRVSMKTFRDLQNFQSILKKYNNDQAAAQDEIMSKFGDTYWAYLIYNKPEKP